MRPTLAETEVAEPQHCAGPCSGAVFFLRMKEGVHAMSKSDETVVRPLARSVARELTAQEIENVAGGKFPIHTHATGPNGDDPGDPGDPAI
jgi:hypothetical protein